MHALITLVQCIIVVCRRLGGNPRAQEHRRQTVGGNPLVDFPHHLLCLPDRGCRLESLVPGISRHRHAAVLPVSQLLLNSHVSHLCVFKYNRIMLYLSQSTHCSQRLSAVTSQSAVYGASQILHVAQHTCTCRVLP